MRRIMLKSKIHRARVTEADVDYVGSITLDRDLMDAADLLPNERVMVVDVDNGARLETYVIEGARGTGVVGINGAAAHLIHAGDTVIIMSWVDLADDDARRWRPVVLLVDASNAVTGRVREERDAGT